MRSFFLVSEGVWVPAHWRLEVCNALWIAERRKRLNAQGVAQSVALFIQLPVLIDGETNARAGSDTLALARQYKISVYDAAYLELALRRGTAIATLDEPLRAVAKTVKLTILPDRSP